MLALEQKVIYGVHGVCRIVDVETKCIDRKNVDYYVLEPLEQPGAKYYIPKDNPVALSRVFPVLSARELEGLFSVNKSYDEVWIPGENQRKQHYRQLIGSGDREALVCMIRALYAHRQQQEEARKKFHQCDENFLRDAQKLLCSEIAAVMDISVPSALEYLRNHI